MKFKKVEIQSFRAYSSVNDGTFDFEIAKDEYADFVSIYAPNGFGKTSFYDAVEWGYTSNIHRFLRRQDFNRAVAKSEKKVNNLDQQNILKNKNTPDLEGFVRLYTTSSDKPIENKIKKARKGSVDYRFDENETKRGYFQQVILSQEWIDAFLKEEDGNQRYRRFIDYFGDKELDAYHRSLVSLLKANENQIAALQDQLNGMQLELAFDGDADILSKINEIVDAVLFLGQKVHKLDGRKTEPELVKFTNTLLENQNGLEFSKQRDEKIIAAVETAFTGGPELTNITSYYELRKQLVSQLNLEKDVLTALKSIEEVEKLKLSETSLRTKIGKLVAERDSIEKMVLNVPLYNEILQQIEELEKQKNDAIKTVKLLEKKFLDERLLGTEFGVKAEAHLNKVQNLKDKIKALPVQKEILARDEDSKKDLLLQKEELEKSIDDLTKQSDALKTEKQEAEKWIKQLKKNQLDGLPVAVIASYLTIADEIRSLIPVEKELNERVTNLEAEVQDQNRFVTELEQFIAKGIEIVQRNQSSSCPLCDQEYGNYEALAAKLVHNKLLPENLKRLLGQKDDFGNQLIATINRKKELFLELGNRFSAQVSDIDKQLMAVRNSLEQMQKQDAEFLTKIAAIDSNTGMLLAIFGGKAFDAYSEELAKNLAETENELASLNIRKQAATAQGEKITADISTLERQLITIKEAVTALKADAVYQEVITYHQKLFATAELTEAFYRNQLEQLQKDLQKNSAELELSVNDQQPLNKLLAGRTKASLEEESKQLRLIKSSLRKQIAAFEQFVKTNLEVDVSKMDQAAVEDFLNLRREDLKKQIASAEALIAHYTLLLQLTNNVQPYLKYEKAKQTEKEIRNRIKLLKEKVKVALTTEKEKVAAHLDEQINSFFYEDLINTIYRKIDPHPEYTHIKFLCNFADDKPHLNVSVTNKGHDHFLIPNLYFSTAQLNILSLSIFLAKALNAKDDEGNSVDCIFIDDPIQSMDSINVLSTIDLLRSIVVNQKKQIILSTHDENFHQLLQKKLPSGLFKSKFLELETFGKVKQYNNSVS